MHVLIVGEMGAGKTTIGQRVARALGRPFVDNDRVLVQRTGYSADQWVTEADVRTLHHLELESFEWALQAEVASVIAVAASVIDSDRGMELMANQRCVIWLRAPIQLRMQRMKAEPDLHTESLRPRALMTELRADLVEARRAERYRSVARFIVDTDLSTARDVTRTVCHAIECALAAPPAG
ncbi:MAG TPA: shikimate kinase [Acidimicrobiales bacterium]|jgi:shikimate kinase|nr:shikimate kinase [Acidimicrobiales bacterium]